MSPCRKAVGDVWRGLGGNGFRFTGPLFDRRQQEKSPLAPLGLKFSLPSDLVCTTSLMLSNLGSHKAPPPMAKRPKNLQGVWEPFCRPNI
jgi:hypothetical protein